MTHGTLDQYKNKKCRCDLCAEASYRYEKRRKYLVHVGLSPTLPAVGFKRRVRALMALGWTFRTIAAELDVKPGNLSNKMGHNTTVTRATHEAMCAIYERLSMTLPPDTVYTRRTRDLSRRRGYVPPLAWDDIDADEAPGGVRGDDYEPTRVEILTDLDERHAGITEACAVLGITRDSLQKWCGNHGLHDLYQRLGSREHRRTENQWTKRGAA